MGTCEFDRLFEIRVVHIHEKIFFSLDYNSFKNCQEVSKSWYNLLTSESSQRWHRSVFREAIQGELETAIRNDQKEVVREMISNGMAEVDCMIQDKNKPLSGITPLCLAACSEHGDIVQLLLDAGAEPDKLGDSNQFPPILYAALGGRLGIVKALLGGGANPNIMGPYGTTALHLASKFGILDVAKLLLNAGSDPNLRDFDGMTSLSMALEETEDPHITPMANKERKERKHKIANILRKNGGTQ